MDKRKQSISQGYDRIGRYYEEIFGDNLNQIKAIYWLIKRLKSEDLILDLGCGTGNPTAKLFNSAGLQVIGIDISKGMLEIARNQVPATNFVLTDMETLPFKKESFKAITAFFSLLHLPRENFPTFINGFLNKLVSHGFFLFSMVEGKYEGFSEFLGQKMFFNAYDREEIKRMIEKLGLLPLKVEVNEFKPKDPANKEIQLFFYAIKS